MNRRGFLGSLLGCLFVGNVNALELSRSKRQSMKFIISSSVDLSNEDVQHIRDDWERCWVGPQNMNTVRWHSMKNNINPSAVLEFEEFK